jgi:hypothetical protein
MVRELLVEQVELALAVLDGLMDLLAQVRDEGVIEARLEHFELLVFAHQHVVF